MFRFSIIPKVVLRRNLTLDLSEEGAREHRE
jgi:hypothetical protein